MGKSDGSVLAGRTTGARTARAWLACVVTMALAVLSVAGGPASVARADASSPARPASTVAPTTGPTSEVLSKPTASVNPVSRVEGASGYNYADLDVRLSGPYDHVIDVSAVVIKRGTADAQDIDPSGLAVTMTIAPGTTLATVPLPIRGDGMYEADETVVVDVTGRARGSGELIFETTAVATILNDDTPPVPLQSDREGQRAVATHTSGTVVLDDEPALSIHDVSQAEGNPPPGGTLDYKELNFALTLSAPSDEVIVVNLSASDQTATFVDYYLASGTYYLNPGETSVTVTTIVAAESLYEADETFTLDILTAPGAIIARGTAVGTIVNDDVAPTMTIENAGLYEGQDGLHVTQIVVRLNQASGLPVTFNYASTDDTATSPSDYEATSGTITIEPGQDTTSVAVAIVGDIYCEDNDLFTIAISDSQGADIEGSVASVLILNDDDPPVVDIGDASVTEGDDGLSDLTFPVTLSAPSGVLTSFFVVTGDGTAVTPEDFDGVYDYVNIPAGETLGSLVVPIRGDTVPESDESMSLTLSSIQGGFAVIGDDKGEGTILDDDTGREVSVSDQTVVEGPSDQTNCVFVVTMSRPALVPVTVEWTTVDGSATSPLDYTGDSQSVEILPGQLSAEVVILVGGDNTFEPDENFTLHLVSAINAALSEDVDGAGTILNDDSPPVLTVDDISLSEGNSGSSILTFTVFSGGATSEPPVTFSWTTADGTAKAPGDYLAGHGTVTFGDDAMVNIQVVVYGDTDVEADETLKLKLSAPQHATIGDGQAIGTIVNDDSTALFIGDQSMVEGDTGQTSFTFAVSLTARSNKSVSFHWTTVNGTARSPEDFVPIAGNKTIPAGSMSVTITVPVKGDVTYEQDESFTVELSAPTGATIADSVGLGTIRNDDALPTIAVSDVSKKEGNSGSTKVTLVVSISKPAAQKVTVSYATADGTASSASDYQSTSGTLTIPIGALSKSVDLTVWGDKISEPDEYFTLNVTDAHEASIADPVGIATILNDEPPYIIFGSKSISEGASGTSSASVLVSLSSATDHDVAFGWKTVDGTAQKPVDYPARSGNGLIRAGSTSTFVDVAVNGDTMLESDETFLLNLTSQSGAIADYVQGVVTIANDDATPRISIGDVSMKEGDLVDTMFTFKLTLSNATTKAAYAYYTTSDGSATAASDYQASEGLAFVQPDDTSADIVIFVRGDTVVEPDETFKITLSYAGWATIDDGLGIGSILNDDKAKLSVPDVGAYEGNSGTKAGCLTVSASSAAPPSGISFSWTAVPGTATMPSDLPFQSGTGVIPSGFKQTCILPQWFGDVLVEPNETFTVVLSNPIGATIGDGESAFMLFNDD